MNIVAEFEYLGYMSKEADDFFGEMSVIEIREGVGVCGEFIRLANGEYHLPSKGDKFRKYENGSICVTSAHRS